MPIFGDNYAASPFQVGRALPVSFGALVKRAACDGHYVNGTFFEERVMHSRVIHT